MNIGDIAMLQVCVRRLQNLWPEAEIEVLTRAPKRLEQYCPGTTPVTPGLDSRAGRAERRRASIGFASRPRTHLAALRRADLVVSSGGGFINDVFWRHGVRVLTLLGLAQHLGKPTAVFSQGIGPLTHPVLGRVVERVMPRLQVIGLREELGSVPILRARKVRPQLIHVTGDDALLLTRRSPRPQTGSAIGLNMRVAYYSAVDRIVSDQAVAVTRESANRRGGTVVALPVSRYKDASDLEAIRTPDPGPTDYAAMRDSEDIQTPEDLAERAGRCRVVVTGSYHAAVFALAAGVPAVCVTNSGYYDLKFEGLGGLFPGGCHVVRPGPRFTHELSDAIDRAWNTSESVRDRLHAAALAQVESADHAYARFKSIVAPTATRIKEG
jgi:colanic acid/amylovoran biosynthesis protein